MIPTPYQAPYRAYAACTAEEAAALFMQRYHRAPAVVEQSGVVVLAGPIADYTNQDQEVTMPPTKKYKTVTVYDDGSYETHEGEVVDAERVTPVPEQDDDTGDIWYYDALANWMDEHGG
jgi:hypothetical protein